MAEPRDPHQVAAEALAMTAVFERIAERLPHGWGHELWDKLFTEVALLFVELSPTLNDEQRSVMLSVGAMIRGQIKKETEATTVFDTFMDDIRGGKIG